MPELVVARQEQGLTAFRGKGVGRQEAAETFGDPIDVVAEVSDE
jgi:hypothetical protein